MIAMKINKKHKKSYNINNFDIDTLKDELIQKPKQLVNKDSVEKRKKKR